VKPVRVLFAASLVAILATVPGYIFSAPYEDVKLKGQ
jgi:hypothetical protein